MAVAIQFEKQEKWFTQGIPPAYAVAKWQQPKFTVDTLYPDNSRTIEYKFNSLGYRDVEWNDYVLNNSIWCIGHSDVLGLGVPVNDRWSSVLSHNSKIATINLGIAGAGWDTISRIIVSGLKRYTPLKIIIQATTDVRREFVNEQKQTVVLPYMTDDQLPYKDFYKHIDSESNLYNVEKNLNLIDLACVNRNVPYRIFDLADRWATIEHDSSVDKTHIGIATHKQIAEELCSSLVN